MNKIKFDKQTKKWFAKNFLGQTTVMKCEKCGLFFKPSLGHKCKGEVMIDLQDIVEARVNGLEEAKERLKDYESMIDDPYASVNAKDVAEDLKTIIRLLEVHG